MNRRLQLLVALAIAALAGVAVAGLAWLRIRDARLYAQPHTVQRGGTNYIVQLVETTVGRVNTNYLVILHLRIQNPNPFALRLARNQFGLVDHDKDYEEPAVTGNHSEWIIVPPNGVAEREALSYTVQPDAFQGTLALYAGQYYFLLVKEHEPFTPKLRDGQFISFRRREW